MIILYVDAALEDGFLPLLTALTGKELHYVLRAPGWLEEPDAERIVAALTEYRGSDRNSADEVIRTILSSEVYLPPSVLRGLMPRFARSDGFVERALLSGEFGMLSAMVRLETNEKKRYRRAMEIRKIALRVIDETLDLRSEIDTD